MAKPPNHRRRRGKRSQQAWQEEEEEAVVDDLAVAASFAQVSAFSSTPAAAAAKEEDSEPTAEKPVDEPTASVMRETNDSEDDSSSDEESVDSNDDNDGSNESDSSDDEFDLSAVLAKMSEEKATKDAAPTTENEVDPYTTPVTDLETKFQLNLTVGEQERLRLDMPACTKPVELRAAGQVKCHMVEDRTIVVESSVTRCDRPLDEGSLLVFRVPGETQSRLVPLGKVFEIFGPVSSPLYTVRLSSPEKSMKTSSPEKQQVRDALQDEAEISLDDEEDEEKVNGDSVPGSTDAPAPEASADEPPVKDSGNTGDAAEPDPWSAEGNYTKLLQSTPKMPVYYIPDVAKLLDTGAVIRNSGRGCDASNLYDEEVINVNEMEFSDDEQEREFKNRRRGKKGRARASGQKPRGNAGGQRSTGYTGFYPQQSVQQPTVQYPPSAQYPQNYAQSSTAAVPQYAQPNPYPYAPQGFVGQEPYAPYPSSAVPPLPPPPPPAYPHAQAQASTNSAKESSDTVYYDSP